MQFSIFPGLEICTITNIFKVQAAAVAWIKQAFWDILVSSLSLLKRFFLNYQYILSLIMNFQPYLARILRYISNEKAKCWGRGEEGDVKASRQKLRPCPRLRPCPHVVSSHHEHKDDDEFLSLEMIYCTRVTISNVMIPALFLHDKYDDSKVWEHEGSSHINISWSSSPI